MEETLSKCKYCDDDGWVWFDTGGFYDPYNWEFCQTCCKDLSGRSGSEIQGMMDRATADINERNRLHSQGSKVTCEHCNDKRYTTPKCRFSRPEPYSWEYCETCYGAKDRIQESSRDLIKLERKARKEVDKLNEPFTTDAILRRVNESIDAEQIRKKMKSEKISKLITAILRDWVARNVWVQDYTDEEGIYCHYENLKYLLEEMNENEEFALINILTKKIRRIK